MQKYLHALNPTPSSQLSSADLAAAPPNTTPSPYEPQPSTSQPAQNSKPPVPGSVLSTEEPEGGQYWRWQEQPNKRQRTDGGDKVCFDFQKGRCERGDKCRQVGSALRSNLLSVLLSKALFQLCETLFLFCIHGRRLCRSVSKRET